MTFEPPIPQELWDQVPPAAQAALTAVLGHYQQRIHALEQRVPDLQERLAQNSTNSNKPPSSDGPAVKRRPPLALGQRPTGGQHGHSRHSRPLLPPDHPEQLRPTQCRRCGQALTGEDPQPLIHQVLELPAIKPTVCWACRCRPPRSGGIERQVTPALTPAVDQAWQHVQTQHANVDETSWRQGRKKGWVGAAVTACVTVFLIRLSRGAGALRDLLGADHDRVVTSDRFTTYQMLPLQRRQVCWAHLRRDFQALIDRGNAGARVGEDLLLVSDLVLHDWHRVRDGTRRRQTFTCRAEHWYRPDLQVALEEGAACGCVKTAATCRELLAVEPALWTFAYVAGVEPTNNAAERALRGPVLWRKGSYGTDRAAGSRFVESILTVVERCRQQGRDVLTFVATCCEALRHNTTPPSLIPPTGRQ